MDGNLFFAMMYKDRKTLERALEELKMNFGNFIARSREYDYLQGYGQQAIGIMEMDWSDHMKKTGMKITFDDYKKVYSSMTEEEKNLTHIKRHATVYWYTTEFGLILTDSGLRIYGSGIVSSPNESIYCLEGHKAIDSERNFDPHYVSLQNQRDLERLMMTEYEIYEFQKTYFVINSYEQLFDMTNTLDYSEILPKIKSNILQQGTYQSNQLVNGDKILDQKGQIREVN